MTAETDMLAYLDANQLSISRVSTALPVPVDNPIKTIREAILTLRPLLGTDLKISLEAIKNAVSAYFDVPVQEFTSPRRERRLVNCRMVYYWLARDLTLASFPMIGRHCGLRDHTTVMHGIHNTTRYWKRYEPAITALKKVLAKA